MIIVVDYDMGNVGSILNMLRKLGQPAKLSFDSSDLAGASGIILPGVGAFDTGMQNLRARGLVEALTEAVERRETPLLGICLGMQLLTRGSEEGELPGLGFVDAFTRRIPVSQSAPPLRIPHMGWNEVRPTPTAAGDQSLSSRLFSGAESDQRYYFVHSYHVCCERPSEVLATTTYGVEITAAVGSANVAGTQFHPEKSLRFGLRLMQNFVEVCSFRAAAVSP